MSALRTIGQMLFHLISRLRERTSIIFTANLAFGEWPNVFGNTVRSPTRGTMALLATLTPLQQSAFDLLGLKPQL